MYWTSGSHCIRTCPFELSAPTPKAPNWERKDAVRSAYLALTAAIALTSMTFNVGAQTWPTKPLRAVVPIAAGSSVDIVARVVFEQLSTQLGQSIIVDNRPGAGTTIGSTLVATAEPDGYTVLVNSSAHTIAPALYPNLSYHPGRDFAAVAPARCHAIRTGRSAWQGLQDRRRSRRLSQGEAGCVQLLVAGRRDRIASQRRALSA